MTSALPAAARVRRGRWLLLLLCLVFFGTLLGAGVLRFIGWQPAGSTEHGQLLHPPVDLRDLALQQDDGTAYPWQGGERRWRIALAPPSDCAMRCEALARDLDKLWRLFGHRAGEVDVLWIGAWPPRLKDEGGFRRIRADVALRARLPGVDDPAGVPLYVIDPHGFVVLRYAPASDLGGLRADVAKLLKLM